MKKELGVLLREFRKERNLKQKEIADYLNITQQTYSGYETGRRVIPASVILKLAEYYGVSTDYLLGSIANYPGSTDMETIYIGNITMHDMVYSMQMLSPNRRRDLMQYLRFLRYRDKSESK